MAIINDNNNISIIINDDNDIIINESKYWSIIINEILLHYNDIIQW